MVARVEAGLLATRAAGGGGGTPLNLLDWRPPASGAAGLLRGRTSALRPHVLAKQGGASVTSIGSSLRPWVPAPTPPWSSDPPLLLPLWVPTLGSTPWVLLLLPLWVLALGSTPWVLALPPRSPGRGGGWRATPKTTCSGPAVVPLPLPLPPTTTPKQPETAGAPPPRALAPPLGGGATPKTTWPHPAALEVASPLPTPTTL